ncbi:MAG: hypothetical protein CMN21_24920, partial [Rubinisphaera sp.]|uniref:hypothetical protein n=1 Tax=Rubinisphaera sp. TaxID=2024857 RepID=UPI000C0F93AD
DSSTSQQTTEQQTSEQPKNSPEEKSEIAEIREEWRQWALSHHGEAWVRNHFEAEWERTKHMIL